MSKSLVRDDLYVRVYGEHEQRIRRREQRVDGEFVYVGTYPAGSNTTPDSPVFKNGWSSNSSEPLRFRWLLSGIPEIRGKFLGGATNTVVFTLPTKVRPDNEFTIPYVGVTNCVGSLTIQTDGDVVWHTECTGAAGGTLEDLMLAKSTLIGWWRLGENPNQAYLLVGGADGFRFANSAPGFASLPLIVKTYAQSGGERTLSPNGANSNLTASDDGALLALDIGVDNVIETPDAGDYGQYFDGNDPWTLMCWFLPGYNPATTAPSEGGAGSRGLVCGPLTMDASGAFNIGVGFVWRSYYNDPGQPGPSLKLWRKNSALDVTDILVPISVAGAVDQSVFTSRGWTLNSLFAYPKGIESPIPAREYDPWYHVAATYDGTDVRVYLNGLLASTTASSFSVGGLTGKDFRIVNGRFDTGVTEYNGELSGAVDEVAAWSEVLTGGEILAIAQAT